MWKVTHRTVLDHKYSYCWTLNPKTQSAISRASFYLEPTVSLHTRYSAVLLLKVRIVLYEANSTGTKPKQHYSYFVLYYNKALACLLLLLLPLLLLPLLLLLFLLLFQLLLLMTLLAAAAHAYFSLLN